MTSFEVPEPILNSPYEEPAWHWRIMEGEPPQKRPGRRPAMYWYRPPSLDTAEDASEGAGTAIELKLVTLIRERVKAWREQGYPGVTRTTLELLRYWRREGRGTVFFFAQLEAAETIVFLTEARSDFLQGLDVPLDEPGEARKGDGPAPFRRYACKMATGAGKTAVMGLLAAWSLLNKIHDRADARFSDVVLVVCPNVTIRSRLGELDPLRGEASIYRTRDIVPEHLMPDLARGRVVVTNWHVFEPQSVQVGGVPARVSKAGRLVRTRETITIGPKTTTARGTRYLTLQDLERQAAAGLLSVIEEKRDREGHLAKVVVESARYVESDTALVARILGREVGGKQNILVFNDEAHHAYRIPQEAPAEDEAAEDEEEREELEEYRREATVWIEGLDRIHRLRGINLCVDLSATPYYLRAAGPKTNRPFPWIVSDFGLTDAIESGLVKIPQLAVRDTTGAEIPGYFNIWRWLLPRLSPSERGGRRGSVKPEAVLRWAHHPVALLAGLWSETLGGWQARGDRPTPPVFILVCKNTKIAKLVFEWLAEDKAPVGTPPFKIEGLRNAPGREVTIRVDSKVVHETDTGEAKSKEARWMRFQLDTVGKTDWPRDPQGRPIYPEGFAELAEELRRPLHPPGRDVRCIVSVGMLTEGWDCNTVTHIVGLRPFMSQLLCEQVAGRALRRSSYEVGPDGKFTEEVAKILGVPFETVPFKESPPGVRTEASPRRHVHAVPERAAYRIRFPRVEGYRQAVRSRIAVAWDRPARIPLDPTNIPTEIQMKAFLPNNKGRPSLFGPGVVAEATLNPYRAHGRIQELIFDLARDLTRGYVAQAECEAPAHVLFPQVAGIVRRYLEEKVDVRPRADLRDIFCSPYYGWVIEQLREAMGPDTSAGESPELPRHEASRGPGSTDEVDFWTSREVREVLRSHVNFVVADTKKWEQSAAYFLDTHRAVQAFVKNAGLGFSIPYVHDGQAHDYVPDFIVRLAGDGEEYLILETKGYDPLESVKKQAAERWAAAVNAEGKFGRWSYAVAREPVQVEAILNR
jgi:type III restriction enzyme